MPRLLRAVVGFAAGVVTTWTAAGLLARRVAASGATTGERDSRWAGDEMVADPSNATTMAVDVAAPAEEVWRWLVQIGADRGGWYSYDWLENLLRLDIHTTDRIREEWQDLSVGDVVVMIPRGWPRIPGLPGLSRPLGIPVAVVDPPTTLVLREDPAEMPWDAVWSFHVVATAPDRCRLLSHSRAHAEPGAAAALARAAGRPMDLVTASMTWRMLRGIRDRAERSVGSSRS